jgi:hypothetical protein
MARLRAGGNTQDANAVNPTLTRPVAILDLEATGAADADQTQAVIDGAVDGWARRRCRRHPRSDRSYRIWLVLETHIYGRMWAVTHGKLTENYEGNTSGN